MVVQTLAPAHADVEAAPVTVSYAGYTVLCADADGWIDGGRSGLFDYDTRILSRYRLTVDGDAPELIGRSEPRADTFVGRYRVRRDGGRAEGPVLPEDALELDLVRVVGQGMRERWSIRNRSAVEWSGAARLSVDADFADIAEVGRDRLQTGRTRRDVLAEGLEIGYEASRDDRRFERAVRVRIWTPAQHTVAGDDGIDLELRLPPRGELRFDVAVDSKVDGRWRTAEGTRAVARTTRRQLEVEGSAAIRVPVERALADLAALRNTDLEGDLLGGPDAKGGGRGRIVNAGVPKFTGFFGRDTLTAGWQSALAGTDILRGALEVAAATQATQDDPWRDAEPGKMLHELRRGPLAMLGVNPRDAYYGSQTTPAMFVLGLSELWHWTGEDGVLKRFRGAALRATEWAERACGIRGFLTYEQRSPAGLRNQGWKDSNEAIRHADGEIAEPPLATVEEQAFHYLALQRMAEILVVLDEPGRADRLLERAAELRSAWHDAFWMPDAGFYALALDGRGQQVRSITSNPGHALGAGMVPADVAPRVAKRLLSDELFSGWGVRTLATDHPSYNPLAYHLGSVWPVENATFALGFKRYGLDDQVERLVRAQLEAAGAMPAARLPEALTGHPREPGLGPSPYPNACAPQAWSASAVIQMVQVLLGIYPFAPLRILALIRPRLPDGVPELTLRNVRVGRASVDLRFRRRPDGSASHEVLGRRGTLLVVPAGPPVDASGQPRPWLESIEQAVLERAPGRLVRAARIAIGLEGELL